MPRLYLPIGYGTRLEMGYRSAITIVIGWAMGGARPRRLDALAVAKLLPEEKRDRQDHEDGGFAYTQWDLEVQNGNSGVRLW
jgi:hypothetical protein